MKKVLLASTMLVMTAGYAAADVAVAGEGRFGILYVEGAADETTITGRLRIIFNASGETDGGLTYGASVRADNAVAGASLTAGEVYISGGFGMLSVGDVDGAALNQVGHLSGVGLTGIGDFNETPYLTGGNDPMARYDYSGGAFGVSLSVDDAEDWAVGVSATFGAIKVALGYEDSTSAADTLVSVGVDAGFGDATVKLRASQTDVTSVETVGLSVDYAFGDTSVTAFAHDLSTATDTAYGLGVVHSLSSDVKLKAGVASDFSGMNRADFGIVMKF